MTLRHAPADQARRREEGLLHRRGRDARARQHQPRDRARASTSRSPGRRAAASRRCCRSSACSTRRRDGSYTLNDQPVANLSLAQRARVRNREIGFIFQSFNLIGDLTVYENVELPLTYRGMRPPSARSASPRRSSAWAWRTAPSICPASSRAVSSSASRWRAPSAGEPSILLADEPTGNLDSKNGEAVMDLLAGAAPQRRHDLHGDARRALRLARRPHDPPLRRPRRRRVDGGSRGATPCAHLLESGFPPGAPRRSMPPCAVCRD